LPNFNIKDSEGQTVLGLALWSGLHNEADRLLGAGANINEKNAEGMTLLHQSIEKQDTKSALFLIEHQADLTIKYVHMHENFLYCKRLLHFLVLYKMTLYTSEEFLKLEGSYVIMKGLIMQ
jgi:hypothetical protein